MFAVRVMKLAQLIGLRQVDVARQLGLHREQVYGWASGRKEVPPKHRDALLRLVVGAAFAFLDAGKADTQHETMPSAADHGPAHPSRRQIEQLIDLLATHGLEFQGSGPSWIIPQMIADMQAFATMTEEQLRDPATAAELEDRTARLHLMCKMLCSLGPLPPRIEETIHDRA